MEQQQPYFQRVIVFFVLSLAVLWAWANFLAPPLPRPQADAQKQQQNAQQNVVVENDRNKPVEARKPQLAAAPDVQPDAAAAPQPKQVELPKNPPNDNILLGSLDPESGYFYQARLSTSGASIVSIKLNDPRYRELKNHDAQLKVVGDTSARVHTLETEIEQIDALLQEKFNTSLRHVDWKVELVGDPDLPGVNSAAVFRFTSPDGVYEVEKKYELTKVNTGDRKFREVRDHETAGYVIDFDLTIRNRSGQPQPVRYYLQGPVGLPLEDIENAQSYRNLKMRYFESEGELDSLSKSSADIVEEVDEAIAEAEENGRDLDEREANAALDKLRNPVKYIGIDVLYFTALLVPQENQQKNPYTEYALPYLVERKGKKGAESDISLVLASQEFELPAGGKLSHGYSLYAGPKRQGLLEPLGAVDVVDYGFFGGISKVMLWILAFFHDNVGFPYGIAIICLTILVRSAMFPITWKQAKGAQKMKELQPKIAELKKKYANDKEKFARAQMELFSENNYNPLAGCLPLILQFPIFIGLYQGLRNAVDLRLAPFLWFDNLAAPDALFPLPFVVPFLGWNQFNLLPLLTIALFILQQKLFMPPPTDEQTAMQHKMMKYMMIFMGFLFYTVPAGLCVYFIASSMWGIGERKLLDILKKRLPEAEPAAAPGEREGKKKPAGKQAAAGKAKKKEGFWDKMLAAADAAQTKSSQAKDTREGGSNGAKKKKKKGKSRSRK